MTTTANIESALGKAAGFVQATWVQVVMGEQAVPGMRDITQNIGLRRLYADSIVLADQLRGGAGLSQQVLATKKIAQDLENGTGPWDMKPMLLGGPKARMGKHGRYNIIPLRHGTSAKYAPNSNPPTMPKDVYAAARALKASVKQANGIKWGGKLTGTESAHPPGKNPSSGYQHKNGKYEGMVRIAKTYKAATQSKFMTFRVVSDNSDPNSWIHPGYEPHYIAKAVAQFCRPAIQSMIQSAAELDMLTVITRVGAK